MIERKKLRKLTYGDTPRMTYGDRLDFPKEFQSYEAQKEAGFFEPVVVRTEVEKSLKMANFMSVPDIPNSQVSGIRDPDSLLNNAFDRVFLYARIKYFERYSRNPEGFDVYGRMPSVDACGSGIVKVGFCNGKLIYDINYCTPHPVAWNIVFDVSPRKGGIEAFSNIERAGFIRSTIVLKKIGIDFINHLIDGWNGEYVGVDLTPLKDREFDLRKEAYRRGLQF